jgi:hypothetical protein
MSDQELRELWIPDLMMTFGAACSALNKSWYGFKLCMRDGDIERVRYYSQGVINKVQDGLGIPVTEWNL